MGRYNLIEEPWIPVRDLAGNRKELGIRDVLLTAENLSVIEDPSPLVTAALHRFLLAVLYRTLEGPCDIDEAKKLFKEGLPKDKIKTYLEKWKNRFWLFHDKYPFGQTPDFEPKAWRSWTVLAAEHNADNAKVLFDHLDVSESGVIQLKQTAKWLLACHTFALGGGNSDFQYVKDAPSASFVMAIPIGKNLLDTLLYCLVPQNQKVMTNDIPMWEREPEKIDQLKKVIDRAESGYADLYTWRSRSVRLKDKNSDGISEVAFASGIGYIDSVAVDPMLAYKIIEVKDKEKEAKVKKKIAVRFNDRGIWREFDSLLPDGTHLSPAVIENSVFLARNDRARYPHSVIVLGQANNKAKVEFWRMEQFILPKTIIRDHYTREDIHSYLEEAKDVNKSLYSACANFGESLLSRGERKPEPSDIKGFITQMPSLPYYWSTLESKFHDILRDYTLECNPDDIHHDWLVSVRNALQEAWSLHEQSVPGGDTWAIRALVKAERIVGIKIKELNESIKKLKEGT